MLEQLLAEHPAGQIALDQVFANQEPQKQETRGTDAQSDLRLSVDTQALHQMHQNAVA